MHSAKVGRPFARDPSPLSENFSKKSGKQYKLFQKFFKFFSLF